MPVNWEWINIAKYLNYEYLSDEISRIITTHY